MSFPKLNPWQLKIENHKFFFFFLNTPIGKWERAGPLQYVKQPSSLHSPPVCPVNHSLISSLSLPNNITCFLWPQDDKQVPIWGLTLPSPRATHHTPACSHDLLFLFAKDSRSWPALGFFLTLLFNFIPFILSSCRGSPYATHFLLLMLATCPFWSVCFTENHQGEKEKITKEPTRKGCDSIRMLIELLNSIITIGWSLPTCWALPSGIILETPLATSFPK